METSANRPSLDFSPSLQAINIPKFTRLSILSLWVPCPCSSGSSFRNAWNFFQSIPNSLPSSIRKVHIRVHLYARKHTRFIQLVGKQDTSVLDALTPRTPNLEVVEVLIIGLPLTQRQELQDILCLKFPLSIERGLLRIVSFDTLSSEQQWWPAIKHKPQRCAHRL